MEGIWSCFSLYSSSFTLLPFVVIAGGYSMITPFFFLSILHNAQNTIGITSPTPCMYKAYENSCISVLCESIDLPLKRPHVYNFPSHTSR
ncbi:hypothetical protein POVWA2_030150 [Plasmodium ovale wallikeri]|uniref:Uncharacterized protein n=1 Tax=Plasmodium ovale wallikeri TaxID=864142 RepID=A0A1A8YY94_PLAOA|nr:hypothetical protein POVWA1_030550 [Plasmodium ovale wallikeri]SBT36431.1 hypothetical protein POVWA2_030150 [Plasmodium ovale wallikeri]